MTNQLSDVPTSEGMDWKKFYELLSLDRSGKPEEALLGFRALLTAGDSTQDQVAVLVAIAGALRKLGRASEASQTLDQIYTMAGIDQIEAAPAFYLDACLKIDAREWNEALELLDRAIVDDTSTSSSAQDKNFYQSVREKRGIVLYELGRYREAAQVLEDSVKFAGEDEKPAIQYYLGRCSYNLGDLTRSIRALEEALSGNLHCEWVPSAHYILGLAHHWREEYARALLQFEWCIEHDQDGRVAKWKVLTALVNTLKALGMKHEAAKYASLLKSTPHVADQKD
jgi:tetratricopeptide (TPR) repeat protein